MNIVNVPLAKISANSWNCKRTVNGAFITSVGNQLLNPVTLRKTPTGWEVIAGWRRCEAYRKLGKATIPATVISADDIHARELTLVENMDREQLSPIEEAREIDILLGIHNGDVAEVAARLGRPRSFVRSRAALASLDVDRLDGLDIGIDNIPVKCLELLAKVPEDIQTAIIEQTPWAIPNESRLQAAIQGMTRTVNGAPWAYDMEPMCSKCPKRTGADPDLFGETDGFVGINDSCLDAVCYAKKERAHVNGVLTRERGKHPGVVLVAMDIPLELREDAKRLKVGILDGLVRTDYTAAKASDNDVVRGVIWCGPQAGTALWCRPAEAQTATKDLVPIEVRRLRWVASQIRGELETVLDNLNAEDRDSLVAASNVLTGGNGEDAVAALEKQAEEEIK